MKKNLEKAILVCMLCICYAGSKAQDPHFSQYFCSPMTLNPALTGKDIDSWRAMADFRSQWWGGTEIAPFTTTAVSIEKKYATGSLGKNGLAIGFSLLSDASNSGLLKNNFFTFGAAYHLSLDAAGNEQLSLGLEGGYANRLVDAGKFEFQSQFGSMGFQRSVPSGDPVNIMSNHYLDMNAGIYYSKDFPSRKWGYHLGAAVFHVGTPEQGVSGSTTYHIERRYSFQGGLVFRPANGDEINVSLVNDNQAPNSIFSLGAVYKIKINDETLNGLQVGIWNRFGDAVYPYVGLQGNKWLIGLSYDVVNSHISTPVNSVQSMEFSLTWLFGTTKSPHPHQVVPY